MRSPPVELPASASLPSRAGCTRTVLRLLAAAATLLIGASLHAGAAADSAEAPPACQHLGAARTFAIEYVAHLPGVPAGTRQLRVWLPVPSDSAVQTIRGLRFSLPPRLTTEPTYGNRFAFYEFTGPSAPAEIQVWFVCTRRELVTDLPRLAAAGEGRDPGAAFAVYRQPSRLGVVNATTRQLAEAISAGQTTTLTKARAIYAHVVATMHYDKTGTRWGTGSTVFACDTHRGNCTDFHSLFNSLCRSEGIATRFEIGLYLPYERPATGPVGGYHCWTYFRVPGRAWVPVDCSEANREPARRTFFFGGHTNNRVTLSVGRDLVLTPAQSGPPVNYLVDPYVEADGVPVAAAKTWSFHDLD